jgi:hypothetical protein
VARRPRLDVAEIRSSQQLTPRTRLEFTVTNPLTDAAQEFAQSAFNAGGILDDAQATNHPTVDQHIEK